MTELIKPTRRSLITGLASLLVAPAIVRVESLMPIRGVLLAAFSGEGEVFESAIGWWGLRARPGYVGPPVIVEDGRNVRFYDQSGNGRDIVGTIEEASDTLKIMHNHQRDYWGF